MATHGTAGMQVVTLCCWSSLGGETQGGPTHPNTLDSRSPLLQSPGPGRTVDRHWRFSASWSIRTPPDPHTRYGAVGAAPSVPEPPAPAVPSVGFGRGFFSFRWAPLNLRNGSGCCRDRVTGLPRRCHCSAVGIQRVFSKAYLPILLLLLLFN